MYITPSGKIGIQGDLGLAALQGKGFKVTFPTATNTREQGHCVIQRPDGTIHEETFTWQDAQLAGLVGKDSWRKYPKTMLRWRAFMQGARFAAADVLGGCYLPEELESMEESAAETQTAEQKADETALNDPALTVKLKETAPEILGAAVASVGAKKRGRPPKSQVNGTPTASTIVVPPAVVSQATTDAVNAAGPDPGPTPAPTPVETAPPAAPAESNEDAIKAEAAGLRNRIFDRFKELRVTLSKDAMTGYYKGWFGNPDRLPRDPQLYIKPLTLLINEAQNFDHTMADKISMDMGNYGAMAKRVHDQEITDQQAIEKDAAEPAAEPHYEPTGDAPPTQE